MTNDHLYHREVTSARVTVRFKQHILYLVQCFIVFYNFILLSFTINKSSSLNKLNSNYMMYLIVESLLRKLLADVPDFGAAERRAVVELALEDARLAAQQLQQLAHRHAGGEPVRVHDHVRTDTLQAGHKSDTQYSTKVKPS